MLDISKVKCKGQPDFETAEHKFSNVRIPAIGEHVNVIMNDLGDAEVVGYKLFKGEGCEWLSLQVHFTNPPRWYVTQNGANVIGTIFGIDYQELK